METYAGHVSSTRQSMAARGVVVPFLDLARADGDLRDEILADVADLIDASAFVNGPPVTAFEEAFAGACGTAEAVGVASGLDALRLALLAAGIERGDEVILPGSTFVATFEAVEQAGGVPVPVDVHDLDAAIDVDAAAAAVSPRTRFLLPVHLYGHMADMRSLDSLAGYRGLTIIEDACQAHGAHRDGIQAGAAGTAGAFSFYPGKNLGAFGDGGAVTTDDAELAARVRMLREHGQREKYRHELSGYTSRLDSLQAAVLLRKLPRLGDQNAERADAAASYRFALDGVGDVRLPAARPGSNPAWHLFVIRTPKRDALAAHLAERGIQTGLHYPEPPHLSPAFARLGLRPGSLPVTERLSAECLSLPMFPGITEQELELVADAIEGFFDGA